MRDEQVSARALRLDRDLQDTVQEQELLWSLVDALEAFAGYLGPPLLDAVLEGCTSGSPAVPTQRTRTP